jgi:hypothetical protein
MSPYEILQPGGSVEYNNEEPGAEWIQRLTHAFPKHAWINPEPQGVWQYRQSISIIQQLIGNRMFPLSLKGLEDTMRLLSKCHGRAAEAVLHRAPVFAGIVRAVAAILAHWRHCLRCMFFVRFCFSVCRARLQPHPTPLWSALLLCGALVLQGCSVLSPRPGAEPAAAVTTEDQPAFSLEVKAPTRCATPWSATWNCSAFACTARSAKRRTAPPVARRRRQRARTAGHAGLLSPHHCHAELREAAAPAAAVRRHRHRGARPADARHSRPTSA